MREKQTTFTDIEYANRKRKTKREDFLKMMESLIPWALWIALIEPVYFEGKRGRPPRGIDIMLRMYLLQQWFHLSDEGVEEAIYDSYAMRAFLKIDFAKEQVPDATTLLKFRHLLEQHKIGAKIFESILNILEEKGLIMHGGTIVDATLIAAPPSVKNETGSRDEEMHSTRKGNNWYFGMKCHVGVDAGTGYIHTVTATAANVHDIVPAPLLIRPDDTVVYADSGYRGIEKRPEIAADPSKNTIDYRINTRHGVLKKLPESAGKAWLRYFERRKSATRCRVEHGFRILKCIFHYRKVSYRGLEKNLNVLHVLMASVNLYYMGKSGRFPVLCSA